MAKKCCDGKKIGCYVLLASVKLIMIEREEIGNDLKFKNLNWCHFE